MEKIEKLVLLPSGPATKLGKVLFVEKYKMNVDNMDIMHMRTLIQDKNGKIGMYCYHLVKLRNYVAHNNNADYLPKYVKFMNYTQRLVFDDETKRALLARVLRKMSKINIALSLPALHMSPPQNSAIPPGIYALSYCKEHWREEIKGKRVLIKEGPRAGTELIMRSWNGTNGTFKDDQGKTIPMSIRTTVIQIM